MNHLDNPDGHEDHIGGLRGPAAGPAQSKPLGMTEDNWEHRSGKMRCRTCIWYNEKLSTASSALKIGGCRRRAPTMSGYPVVFPGDWCGDHKLDENSA